MEQWKLDNGGGGDVDHANLETFLQGLGVMQSYLRGRQDKKGEVIPSTGSIFELTSWPFEVKAKHHETKFEQEQHKSNIEKYFKESGHPKFHTQTNQC